MVSQRLTKCLAFFLASRKSLCLQRAQRSIGWYSQWTSLPCPMRPHTGSPEPPPRRHKSPRSVARLWDVESWKVFVPESNFQHIRAWKDGSPLNRINNWPFDTETSGGSCALAQGYRWPCITYERLQEPERPGVKSMLGVWSVESDFSRSKVDNLIDLSSHQHPLPRSYMAFSSWLCQTNPSKVERHPTHPTHPTAPLPRSERSWAAGRGPPWSVHQASKATTLESRQVAAGSGWTSPSGKQISSWRQKGGSLQGTHPNKMINV